MATLIHPNRLAQELPQRLEETREQHQLNWAMFISSVLIALALVALSWCIYLSSFDAKVRLNPMNDVTLQPLASVRNIVLAKRTEIDTDFSGAQTQPAENR